MRRYHLITNTTTGETTVEEIPDGVSAETFIRQQMDDCPLCQEARARGEVPVMGLGPPPIVRRPPRWPRPPRWRTRKRG